MSNYTLAQLEEKGPQYAMALLLRCLKEGEPFVTYGAICEELEYQLGIDNIFTVQIGKVAGALMDLILEIDPKAPLINALITHPDGLPGKGIGRYFARRYNNDKYNKWKDLPRNTRIELVAKERNKVFRYKKWLGINKQLFGLKALRKLRSKNFAEKDGINPTSGGYGGEAESKEHKMLKKWVAENPQDIGLKKSFGQGVVESRMMSGDLIDVLFTDGDNFIPVEVKSIRSNDEDLKRGVYQCVKYKAVKLAEHYPVPIKVQSILVTEKNLPNDLKARAKQLGVIWKKVSKKNKLNRANKSNKKTATYSSLLK